MEMSDSSIPHFQPLTLPGRFPESDVRGAAAREAASGRQTYLSWEEKHRLQLEHLQKQQALQDELDALKSDDEVKLQLRRYMRALDAATAANMVISDAAEKARHCPSFDLRGLMTRVYALAETIAKALEAERNGSRAATPVTSPFTSPSSMEVLAASSSRPASSSSSSPSPSPRNEGSPPSAEMAQDRSLEPVADYALVGTETAATPPWPAPRQSAKAKRMTRPATDGPTVTRSGRTVKPPKRLRQ
ncbi:hypothetical protein PpBr36_07503 [Pyricularia pennisetigena]|uniref:hypothetical protein n=1 Tax=Pyricularia pennisetigena TaxID=1578925 RepID=UPI0011525D7B|nr:hypothetical protein PpBr36_07503 [Pyricularia pennisetigena]TLS24949.1 hypothetical protein PpBr36_07503 [Pyricularia pennisetigena]